MMDDSMDSSYGNAPVSPPDQSADKAPAESVDEQNAGSAEILIGKDKLPAGTRPGDTCTFKVSQDAGDEFILEFVKEGEDDTSETMTENPEAVTDRELTALDSQGQ